MKVNVVVKRGLNDGSILDLARHFKAAGHTLRFIEYMDVGHTNGWRLDDVVPAAEIVASDRRRAAARACRAFVPRRGRAAVSLPRRQRRDRRHRLRHPAVLRRLHAGAALGRRQALHVPLRRSRARPARARPLRGLGRGGRRDRSPASGSVREDRYSELRKCRDSRPPQGRDVIHRRVTSSLAAALPRTPQANRGGPRCGGAATARPPRSLLAPRRRASSPSDCSAAH